MLKPLKFDWDQWNVQKNEIKHGASWREAESAFHDSKHRIFKDIQHSTSLEQRYVLYGRSMENRILMIAFTKRRDKVRVISARPASKKERAKYED